MNDRCFRSQLSWTNRYAEKSRINLKFVCWIVRYCNDIIEKLDQKHDFMHLCQERRSLLQIAGSLTLKVRFVGISQCEFLGLTGVRANLTSSTDGSQRAKSTQISRVGAQLLIWAHCDYCPLGFDTEKVTNLPMANWILTHSIWEALTGNSEFFMPNSKNDS
jgi:hypothetical protein